MNILVSVNSLYVEKMKTMLFSLRTYCTEENIAVYLLNSNLNNQEVCEVKEYLWNEIRIELKCIDVKDGVFWENMPLGDFHFSVEIYYRIFAQFLLPENLERILWLDSDIIINGDISSFYSQNFEGKSLVACLDMSWNSDFLDDVKNKIGFKHTDYYFNSGVLLLNLTQLRNDYSYEYILDFCCNMKEKLTFPDQDILNCLYKDKVKYAEANKYNYQVCGKKIILNREDSPYIIHYIGGDKPWMFQHINKNSWCYWRMRCKQHHYFECFVSYSLCIAYRGIKGFHKLYKKLQMVNGKGK